MRMLHKYIDKDGMIKSRGDYGDCIHNIGTCYFQIITASRLGLDVPVKFWEKFNKSTWEKLSRRLEIAPGRFCRHPDPESWTSNPQTLSRDAVRPFLRAAKALGDDGIIKRFAWDHAKRLWLFMPNIRRNGAYPEGHPKARKTHPYTWKVPDPTGPVFWAFLLRCLDVPIYPLFWFADLISVLKSYMYVWKAKKKIKTKGHKGDIRNHHEHLQFCKLYYNTWFNDWAMRVYARIKPQEACDLWWSEKRNEAPIGRVMTILNKYFGWH